VIDHHFARRHEADISHLTGLPGAGDLVHVTAAASVQFVTRPIFFRVIRAFAFATTPDGFVYLDGYECDTEGLALERRTILVQPAGLHRVEPAPSPRTQGRRPTNAGPRVPRQRQASPTTTSTTGGIR
jgi:hypothetical protein